MESPYREPEVPAAVEAERRLDARMEALSAASAEERRRAHLRAVRNRRMIVSATIAAALWLAVAIVLLALGVSSSFVAGSALVCGVATPTGLILALGMKIPPRPEDAPPVVSTHRVG